MGFDRSTYGPLFTQPGQVIIVGFLALFLAELSMTGGPQAAGQHANSSIRSIQLEVSYSTVSGITHW